MHFHGTKHGLSLLGALFIGLMSCTTIPADPTIFETSYLVGAVYGGNSQGVYQATITVDGGTAVLSDINGRFTIESVSKGTHVLHAYKEGYESLDFHFDFQSRTQVVYFVLYSREDYLVKARNALSKSDFAECDGFIQKMLLIDPHYVQARFFQALYHYKLTNYAKSYELVESLVADGIREQALFLLELDIALLDKELGAKIVPAIEKNIMLANTPGIREKLALFASGNTKNTSSGDAP